MARPLSSQTMPSDDARSFDDLAGPLRPVDAASGVNAHLVAALADHQAIDVVLDFVDPIRPRWRPDRNRRQARRMKFYNGSRTPTRADEISRPGSFAVSIVVVPDMVFATIKRQSGLGTRFNYHSEDIARDGLPPKDMSIVFCPMLH